MAVVIGMCKYTSSRYSWQIQKLNITQTKSHQYMKWLIMVKTLPVERNHCFLLGPFNLHIETLVVVHFFIHPIVTSIVTHWIKDIFQDFYYLTQWCDNEKHISIANITKWFFIMYHVTYYTIKFLHKSLKLSISAKKKHR